MTNTLASLALLKVTWDRYQKDVIDNFVLLLITLLNKKRYNSIEANGLVICQDFEAEYGFSIPYHPMVTVLKKATRLGYLKRAHGKYFPVWERIERDDITDMAQEQEARYKYVIDEFLEFCVETYEETLSEQDASDVFISVLRDHDLDILFAAQHGSSLLPAVAVSAAHRFLMFSFIRHVCETNPVVFAFIVALSVGHIIANTILVRNYPQMQGKLDKACFYLDAGFLFNVTGTNGTPMQEAYSEWVRLVRSQGVSLFVFRHSYQEFLSILEGCLHWIEHRHFDPKKASRALLNFRDRGWSASDVEEFIVHLDEKLSALDIAIVDVPPPMEDKYYQIDEEKLQGLIVEIYRRQNPLFDEEEKDYTIYQDVKSITAVYKLRRGNQPRSLAQARHIFVTTNASLALASRQFEQEESGIDFHYIPAALTDVFVGTLIWLRSPSRAQINEKRLIAIALAALQPSKAFLKSTVATAERLKQRGAITENDVVLLTESRMARNLLQEETLGDPDRLSEDAITDVLETMQSKIRQEEAEKFRRDREDFQTRLQQAENDVQQAQEDTQSKHEQLEIAREHWQELVRIKDYLDNKAYKRIDRIMWLGFIDLVALWVLLGILIFTIGWGTIEPYLFLVGLVPSTLAFLYFIFTKREAQPSSLYEKLVEFEKSRSYKEAGFDIEEFQRLQIQQSKMTDL